MNTPKALSLSLSLLLVSILAGLAAGLIFRSNNHETEAASANISITDNDQSVSVDQATSDVIVAKTSQVTIKDSTAQVGYTLSAKLTENTLPFPTVTISSSSSTTCPTASPCTLSTSNQAILTTTNNAATTPQGDTTTWEVKMTIPGNTMTNEYILDIEYSQDPEPADPMQGYTKAQCDALALGTTKWMYDARDNKVYRVRKMADGNCWMVDNLAFDLANGNTGVPAFSPAAALVTTQTSVNTQAQYASNTGYNTAAGQTTYLYNWCAALGDTSSTCSASRAANINNTVINGALNTSGTTTDQPAVTGICPAPFRLPKGGPQATSSSSTTTANEFARLDIAMGGTGTNRSSANTYPNFMANNNSDSTGKSWSGVLGGYFDSGLFSHGFTGQGTSGWWWSSTATVTSYAYSLGLGSSNLSVYPAIGNDTTLGYAVRCVL